LTTRPRKRSAPVRQKLEAEVRERGFVEHGAAVAVETDADHGQQRGGEEQERIAEATLPCKDGGEERRGAYAIA
jgi:hypothetical protein